MATVTAPVTAPPNDRVVLHGVRWETYAALRRDLGDNLVRLTYDGSDLEIMSPSRMHESAGRMIGKMITLLGMELNIDIASGGSTTFQRADLERGLEPDECFWIAHEPAVRDKFEIDLATDPPPDLAIEVEISPSRLRRSKIYALLGVPEIWRYDGQELHIDVLSADGSYLPSATSLSFPFLPVAELGRFITGVGQHGETRSLQMFVQWLRDQHLEHS